MGSRVTALFGVLVLALAVIACSGGDTGSPSSTSPSSTAMRSISGSAIANTTITASGPVVASTTVDASGNYVLLNLADGNYTVTPSRAGYVFTPTSTAVPVSGVNVVGINFTGTFANIPTYGVSGTVSGGVQSGVLLSLSPGNASVVTDVTGRYILSGLPDGNYTVTPSRIGHIFTPASTAVAVTGADVVGINFTGTLANVSTYSISGKILGQTQSGSSTGPIVDVLISLSPGNASAVTDAFGNYVLSGIVSGAYTVTPSIAGHTFTPASTPVIVNGANVSGVNFVELVPMLASGKLLYPCTSAICTKDLSIGVESVKWSAFNIQPTIIVPMRGASQRIAYGGANIDGILTLSLTTLAQRSVIPGGGFLAQNCSSATMERSFDTSSTDLFGDIAVIPSPCLYPGVPLRTDIFAVKMNGSLFWLRVTDDASLKYSPVFGGQDPATGRVTVLFFKESTSEIWQQVIDPVNAPSLVGTATIFANNAMNGDRVMSVNATYTHVAFMKNMNDQSHIVVRSLTGGVEVDLGLGSNPYWALDGSNLILYTADSQLWAINQDGTGKKQVPVPSNLWGGLSWVVFGPAGF